jgi:uncharacterized protein (DUF433 family)
VAVTPQSDAKGKSVIVRDPHILDGEPTVRGTRIPVRSIVLAAQEYGGSQGVLTAYPQLAPQAIQHALDYYVRHREEIDRYIRDNLTDD